MKNNMCVLKKVVFGMFMYRTGPGCSKLTTSLVNVPLKFLTLISKKGSCQLLAKVCARSTG